MNRSLAAAAVLLVALSAPASLIAQNAPAAQPLPKDPVALLQLASQVNGLHGDDLQPWHLHATWQTVEKGNVQDEGTYEEWWASQNKYKINYTAKNYQETLYVTGHGAFLRGDTDTTRIVFSDIVEMVDQPLPDPKSVDNEKWKIVNHRQGNVMVTCAALKANPPLPQYCFADQLPALRIFTEPWESTAWNSVVLFQNRYLGETIRIVRNGSPEIDIKIDQLETLNQLADSDFVPPANAVPAGDHPVFIPAGKMSGMRTSGQEVEYPAIAKALHLQGTVLLLGTILTDGSISDLKVISGPAMLQQAAVQAVRTWHYRPYVIGGQAVEVKTQIRVIFSLGS